MSEFFVPAILYLLFAFLSRSLAATPTSLTIPLSRPSLRSQQDRSAHPSFVPIAELLSSVLLQKKHLREKYDSLFHIPNSPAITSLMTPKRGLELPREENDGRRVRKRKPSNPFSVISPENRKKRKAVSDATGNGNKDKAAFIPLRNINNGDFMWTGKVKLGVPSQTISVLFDTGSADFWTSGVACVEPAFGCSFTRTGDRENSQPFFPNRSRTFWSENSSHEAVLQYDSANVTLNVGSDVLSFGSGAKARVTVGLSFAVAPGALGPFSGIIGLGFSSLAAFTIPSVFDSMVSKNIFKPKFSFYLNRAVRGGRSIGAQLTLGGYPLKKLAGRLKYAPVVDPDYWAVQLTDVKKDGETVFENPRELNMTLLLDSGTSYLMMSAALAAGINEYLGGSVSWFDAGTFLFPCSTLTVFSLTINGVDYAFSPNDWLWPVTADGQTCSSLIYGMDDLPDSQVIAGDLFLLNYLTVFEVKQRRVGFGRLKT